MSAAFNWVMKSDPKLASQLLALVEEAPSSAVLADARAEVSAAKKLKYIMSPRQMQTATRLINSGGKTACDAYLREEENKFIDERLKKIGEAELKLVDLQKRSRGIDGLLLDVIKLGLAQLSQPQVARGKA